MVLNVYTEQNYTSTALGESKMNVDD